MVLEFCIRIGGSAAALAPLSPPCCVSRRLGGIIYKLINSVMSGTGANRSSGTCQLPNAEIILLITVTVMLLSRPQFPQS